MLHGPGAPPGPAFPSASTKRLPTAPCRAFFAPIPENPSPAPVFDTTGERLFETEGVPYHHWWKPSSKAAAVAGTGGEQVSAAANGLCIGLERVFSPLTGLRNGFEPEFSCPRAAPSVAWPDLQL